MIKNKQRKIIKKISWIIIPSTVMGMIFPLFNVVNKVNDIKSPIAPTILSSKKNTFSSDTSDIILNPNQPNHSNVFAGEIFNELFSSNGNQFYQDQLFDSFLQIVNPVSNGMIIQKKIECVEYRDDEGKLVVEAQITPWLNAGTISNTFSPKKTFTITGFNKYKAPTTVSIKPGYPTNKKPSEIYESNITNYLEITNLPNSYEVQPKTSFTLKPNDNLGILDVEVTLSTGIVENPSNGTFYFKNTPIIFNVRIENLSKQPSTSLPSSDRPIDGSSLNKIAERVTQYDIRDLIVNNSSPLPSDFDRINNIFDVVISEQNNDEKRVVFSAKIFNIFNQEGILITSKANAILLDSILINNLKEPINTTLSLKKEGTANLLAQEVCESKTDKELINEYINVENAPSVDENFSVRIDQKTFNNNTGTITLDLIMRNFYELGSIIHSESRVIRIIIPGFKHVKKSTTTALNQIKSIYASDVNLVDNQNPNFIENFISNSNYPDGTTFAYKILDVDNSIGVLKIDVIPSKWYDSNGVLLIASASNSNKTQLIIENFAIRGATNVIVNPETTTPELIGNIYPTDVQDAQIKNYIKFNYPPDNLDYEITNVIRRNSSQSISFDVVLKTYFNEKGLLMTPATSSPKTIKIAIKGFKYRGKSYFTRKQEASNILPSDVNESNWQNYIGIDLFPQGTTFSSVSLIPINRDGTLSFSAIPSKFYDVYGDEQQNSGNELFKIFLTSMNTKNQTVINPLIKDSSNEALFNFFPEELDKKITSSGDPKSILKDYITFTNPYSDSLDDYEIIYNPILDPATKFNNISGELTFKVKLKNYYNDLGNPILNTPKDATIITISNFKKVVPNFLIHADVNKNLSAVDPYDLIKNPQEIINYITFNKQPYITDYSDPKIEIISVSGGEQGDVLLNQGLVLVEYKINNYFNQNGILISKGDDSQNWDSNTFIIGGFKSRLHSNNSIDFIALVSIIIAITLFVIIIVICLGILFRRKRYYINENYDRGLINANETTIPLVIKTRDKIKNSRPKLIPLLKEEKPPKPLKQYKPIKHKEVKVKPPKQPILPGQRKREMIESLNKMKNNFHQKIKSAFDFDKLPVNEPFEIDNKWYFKNEEGKYFVANDKNEWSETKKPKMKKQKKTKEQKKEDKKQN